MPVYNNERYVAEAIESILKQTLEDFEFIIVDDGSRDGSGEILERFAARDGRIRLISRGHVGIVMALNEAAAQARGAFIARMDADDISRPTRLSRQVEYLRNNPDCLLVGCRVLLIDPRGAPICEFAQETTHEEIDRAHFELRWPLVHPAIVVRREALLSVGGYRRQYETLEDYDLFLRLGERGRLANLPDVLLLYRQHLKSMCHAQSERQNAIREAIYREACVRRGIAATKVSAAFIAPRWSRATLARRWAWLALDAGNVSTARRHALHTLCREPLTVESWRVALCALRGR